MNKKDLNNWTMYHEVHHVSQSITLLCIKCGRLRVSFEVGYE